MTEYELFKVYLTTHPGAARRKDAKRAHEKLLAECVERIEQLIHLVESDGVEVSFDDSSLQPLNDWFIEQVNTRPPTEAERAHEEAVLGGQVDLVRDYKLSRRTESLIIDIALFIGELLIQAAPHLKWNFVTKPKNDASYQRTVLAGFQSVKNKRYHVDLEGVLVGYAYQIVAGSEHNQKEFVLLYETGLRLA